ncbi:MAG TPA: hypothetical protein G4N96_14430 [Chloroflexi bacterium]|nr:MAG: hypothetical protein B6243_01265 [Anaerolineaceae bacterium 4572_5.2]HEY86298.1 hypothetical protein [Chloroflexota bacterium]
MYSEVNEQVQVEVEQIDHLLDQYTPLIRSASQSEPNFFDVAALGTLLHSFYTGIENIFKRISLEIDGDLPSGACWHSDLLNAMAHPTDQRGAVIPDTLRLRLKEYLSFRHVFRQAYTFNLSWGKMAHLVLNCQDAWQQLKGELSAFFTDSTTI